MLRLTTALASMAALAAAATVGLAAAPAQAASTGQVVVFSTEFQPLDTYQNPDGCHSLPITSHVVDNLTDKPIRIYADPFCLTPSLTIQPGYGSHVSGTGSFSA